MKDVNDLMQAILEMDAAQRKASEKAKGRAYRPVGGPGRAETENHRGV